jgi:hypothetical protein
MALIALEIEQFCIEVGLSNFKDIVMCKKTIIEFR